MEGEREEERGRSSFALGRKRKLDAFAPLLPVLTKLYDLSLSIDVSLNISTSHITSTPSMLTLSYS